MNLFKFVKSPLNLFFTIIFPIIWTFISFYTWGGGNREAVEPNQVHPFIYSVAVIPLMMLTNVSIIYLPTNFGFDRVNNRNKFYLNLNIKAKTYLFSNLFACFTVFLIGWNLITLLSAVILPSERPIISVSQYFALLFVGIFGFITSFCFASIFSFIGNTEKTINVVVMIHFYIVFVTSGVMIPAAFFDINDVWMKYVQYLQPIGATAKLSNSIVGANPGTLASRTPMSWDFNWTLDWLTIVVPIIEAVAAIFIFKKLFNWKI
ncbi:hypothetical protein [Mycoplasmoides fastidiosum]|nr:hypothetical protein [Mycoplasmoides fastidiosum]